MADAIHQSRSGDIIGSAVLGNHGEQQGSVKQQVHDGDTIVVRTPENLGVRFLGVDAPEISFQFPLRADEPEVGPDGKKTQPRFVSITNPDWEDFLDDPFDAKWRPFKDPLDADLVKALKKRLGAGAATNHADYAKTAQTALEEEVAADLQASGLELGTFRFFLRFATDVVDRYGRLLCHINLDAPDTPSAQRPDTYNERVLKAGHVTPYFIWPNVDPFIKQPSLTDAVPKPGQARAFVDSGRHMRDARQWVRDARTQKIGVYADPNPLKLLPFELRFLARRGGPDRWLIDLGADDDVILAPENYHAVDRVEDRLFIPTVYLPLFVARKWKTERDPKLWG